MRSLALLGLVGTLACAAACGGDPQLVLELAGATPGATHVEVMLLEPLVVAREQRHNYNPSNTPSPSPTASGTLETVFYLEERSRTTFELAGALTDGLRFEVQGAGGPYVPLVAVRDGDRLLALGVYAPESIAQAELGRDHVPDAVAPVSDVTIFPIQLEPVDRVLASAVPGAQAVKPREVMVVSCVPDGAISGFAWRRADGVQLRVLVPLAGQDGKSRLDPPDLDCDRHSPGRAQVARREPGDQRDCDDTTFTVHGGARERCTPMDSNAVSVDEDCNSDTIVAPRECTQQCAGGLQLCACEDGRAQEECLTPFAGGVCKVPAMASGPGGKQACESEGPIRLPPLCLGGCQVLLAWAPDELEVKLSDAMGLRSYGLGAWAPMEDDQAYLSIRGTKPLAPGFDPIIMRIKAGAVVTNFAVQLTLVDAVCGATASRIECPQ
jgi:hypothetical protein